ncbi:MAG: methionyl-tRNA formyltransferase [Planctomycetes bacterium]|jgi:methionyl-tRNA formyltransferase|nr:methionyl-tRNA formyltransferase [Planctomycetota bacterium]
MNLVYLGSGEFGVPCLDALQASGQAPCLIVTQPANPAGRGRRPQPTPVAEWAAAHGVSCAETGNVNAPDVVPRIAACRPEVIVVIAFGQKIGKEVVALPPRGAINVHASLLPKYRGAAPINWAILRGETHTGNSIITLADKIDAGEILGQVRTEIGPQETAGELHDRLARLAAPLLLETLAALEAGTATYTKQNDAEATFAPKLRKSDGFLDFHEPAEAVVRRIRGLTPWPGAAASHVSAQTEKSTRVILAAAQVVTDSPAAPLPAGTFDSERNVICGAGKLRIEKIKPAGSGLMSFHAFINGWHVQPGDRLTKIEEEPA